MYLSVQHNKKKISGLCPQFLSQSFKNLECYECLYRHIFGRRDLMKLGAMFCHSDVIAFGSLPYTDFRRTQTLCQGGDCCDFDFIRHGTDAGDGWERSKCI